MRREKRPFKEHKIRKCGVTKCDAVTWSGDYHWPRCRLYARVPGSMDKNVPKSHDFFSSLLRHRWKRKKKGQKEASTAAPEGGQFGAISNKQYLTCFFKILKDIYIKILKFRIIFFY